MEIYGPASVHGPQSVNAPHAKGIQPQPTAARPTAAGDELSISDAGRLLDKINDLPEVRNDRVQAIRDAIAAGTYETEAKLGAALDQLLEEIG